MKKIIIILFAAVLLTSCSSTKEGGEVTKEDKISIVTTTFATFDWAKEIVKGNEDNFEITYLLDSGMDLHSFQPTADDIVQVAESDIFIYVGGESEEWVNDILKDVTKEDLLKVNLSDTIQTALLEEELVEGMEEEAEEGEEEGIVYDEHIWLSVKNAIVLVSEIEKVIASVDLENESLYLDNVSSYSKKLEDLDLKYEEMVIKSEKDTLLFGDRFPFRYFVNDYGLNYYAAFIGCSAETEASFETVIFLSNKLDELKLDYCLTVDGTNEKLAKTIIENSKNKNRSILELNSMQKLTSENIESGVSYLDIMEENYLVFEEVLK